MKIAQTHLFLSDYNLFERLVGIGNGILGWYTRKRTLFYWIEMYYHQIQKGDPYSELKKCVTINILNIEIHVMELTKLKQQAASIEGGLVNWLLFLSGVEPSSWEVLTVNEPMLKKAMTTLEFLSKDEQTRMEYEARLKYLRDEASRVQGAKEEGRAEGHAEGMAEGVIKEKRETARKLLARGESIASVIEFTGLMEREVRALMLQHD